MGRPSTLTAARKDAVERAFAVGAPLSVAAESAGVSRRTVSRWLGDGRVVRRSLSAVPDEPVAEPVVGGDDDAIQRALVATVLRAAQRGDWKAAKWLLETRWPDRFRR
jgi:hypothetical protein